MALAFLLVATLNYLYNSSFSSEVAPQVGFLGFLGKTLAIGMFPLLAMIFLVERLMHNRNEQAAQNLATQFKDRNSEAIATPIYIRPETNKSDPLKLDLDEFLFAESDNNYTTFYRKGEEGVVKDLLRVSIKNAAQQLSEIDEIVRCHRSYLVNKKQITNISGNARSLTVELKNLDRPIPVSRSFSREQLG